MHLPNAGGCVTSSSGLRVIVGVVVVVVVVVAVVVIVVVEVVVGTVVVVVTVVVVLEASIELIRIVGVDEGASVPPPSVAVAKNKPYNLPEIDKYLIN
jgi:hypothetical protein